MNTDRFPTRASKAQAFSGVRRHALPLPPRNVFDYNFLKSPFLGFWVIRKRYWPFPFSSNEALHLASSFLNIFIMKNLTYLRKTVKTGVDPRLITTVLQIKCSLLTDPLFSLYCAFHKKSKFWTSWANWRLRFSLPSIILADLENRSLLQRVQKVMVCDLWISNRSVFQGSLLVIVIMIESSEKRTCKGGFWTSEFVWFWKTQ